MKILNGLLILVSAVGIMGCDRSADASKGYDIKREEFVPSYERQDRNQYFLGEDSVALNGESTLSFSKEQYAKHEFQLFVEYEGIVNPQLQAENLPQWASFKQDTERKDIWILDGTPPADFIPSGKFNDHPVTLNLIPGEGSDAKVVERLKFFKSETEKNLKLVIVENGEAK